MKPCRVRDILPLLATLAILSTAATAPFLPEIESMFEIQTKIFNVKAYGAQGDGSTNDANAFNAAASAASQAAGNAGRVYCPPGVYVISSTVTFTSHVECGEAQLNTSADITAIQIGDGTNYVRDKRIILPRIKDTSKTGLGWSKSNIGVKVVNALESTIQFSTVENFGTGISITAAGGKGNSYNTYILGLLDDNKVQLLVKPADATSWTNENLFIGGRFLFNSAELQNPSTATTGQSGTRNIQIDMFANASAHLPNNNVFIKPSLEGDVPEYHADILGGWNYIDFGRWEATVPKVNYRSFDSTKIAQKNAVRGGYNNEAIVYTEDSNSKNNLKSDDIYEADLTLTHAQVLACNSTPIQIVKAPGGGKALQVVDVLGTYTYGGVAAYSYAGSMIIVPTGATGLTEATLGTNLINQTASTYKVGGAASNINIQANNSLSVFCGTANPTAGDATNVVKIRVRYRIVPVPLP